MRPESVRYQATLAEAIRKGQTDGFNPQRLAIYIRLIRNNIFSFINRCYTETPKYCPDGQWNGLLEAFVRNGAAHSPYFQDIAETFYHFCRENHKLPEHLLALMDLEQTQLQAEIAPYPARPSKTSALALAPCAFLRDYPESFKQHFPDDALSAAGQMLVWRDPADRIRWIRLSPIDYILLGMTSEQAYTETSIIEGLSKLMPPDDTAWQPYISARWQHWQKQGVLCHV